MTARKEVLARIRKQPRTQMPPLSALYQAASSLTTDQRTALFCARAAEYRASVIRTPHNQARAAVAAAARGMRVVAAPGFPRALWPDQLIVDDQLSNTQLDSIDGALTAATLGIANTGTIVLSASPLEGRRAMTLIPDTHICVVDCDQIVETVPEALDRLSTQRSSDCPLTFISGPSATSDIEMRRVEGVHGPRQLVVIVRG